MRRFWFLPLMCLVLLAGCGTPPEEEFDEDEVVEEPPPTAEEIAMQFSGALQPFEQLMVEGLIIPPARIAEGVNAIQSLKSQHQATENGEEGVRQGAVKVQDQLKRAYAAKAWGVVLFDYAALQVLDNAATENYQRQFRWASLQANRPQVAVRTVWTDEAQNITTLFCEVFAPATGQTQPWQASVGDVWSTQAGEQEYAIRLDSVIGKNSGGVFTYIQTEEQFEVTVVN